MIIVFSGTGNSYHVADLLYVGLGYTRLKLEGADLLASDPQIELEIPGEPIVWVFPTYSWGIPPIVLGYIRKIRQDNLKDLVHHLVLTCGDDIGNLPRQWKRLLASKGWKIGGVWTVQMPNTYVLMKGFDVDTPEVEKKKLGECPGRVSHISERIKEGSTETDVLGGSWRWIKSSVIYPWFVRFAMSPKPFHADRRCTGCGLCGQECPMHNISMRSVNDLSVSPSWGDNCALCLRCYHNCPANAICYGNATKGKGQYKFRQSLQ